MNQPREKKSATKQKEDPMKIMNINRNTRFQSRREDLSHSKQDFGMNISTINRRTIRLQKGIPFTTIKNQSIKSKTNPNTTATSIEPITTTEPSSPRTLLRSHLQPPIHHQTPPCRIQPRFCKKPPPHRRNTFHTQTQNHLHIQNQGRGSWQ
ncbi:hypothetical protein Droror1_Dr00023865 [Drosera rotundifolia]